jgi:hypothetical protein
VVWPCPCERCWQLVTFEREDALFDEGAVVAVAHVAAGAGRPEQRARHADLPGGLQGEAHDAVADDAGDRRRIRGGVEVGEQGPQVREAGLRRGAAERGHVLGDVRVGRRAAVRDGGEAEAREAVERAGAAGAEEAAVVVLRVHEGDVEAPAVEDLAQLQHRRDVALRREWHQHSVRLAAAGGGADGAHLVERLLCECVNGTNLFRLPCVCVYGCIRRES